MKESELAILTPNIENNISLNVANEDLVNILAVKYEKDLRDERERLVANGLVLQAKDKKTSDVAISYLQAAAESVAVPLINVLTHVEKLLSKYINKPTESVKKLPIKMQRIDNGLLSTMFNRKDGKMHNTVFYIRVVNVPSCINSNSLKSFAVKIPISVKRYAANTVELNKEIADNIQAIAAVDRQLRDVDFNTKLVRAKITESTLDQSKEGKKILADLTRG